MKNKKICPFCFKSTPEVSFTNEHIIPRWIQKHVTDENEHIYELNKLHRTITPPHIRRISVLNITVNKVCNECNNGWMSQKIEAPLKPLLLKMIKGEEIKLNTGNRYLIALWSLKTALVRSLMEENGTAAIASHFELVRNGNLPDNLFIWAVKVDAWDNPVKTRHIWFGDEFFLGEARMKKCLCHSTSITIEHISFQIICLGDHHSGLIYTFDAMKENLPKSSALLWPPSPPDLTWPPDEGISFDPKIITAELAKTYIG